MNTTTPDTGELAINESDYHRFCRYFEQSSGLVLGQGKEYLIRSRLAKLLRSHALPDFAELLRKLERNEPGVRDLVLDAMTTNETFWFREPAAFEVLQAEAWPAAVKAGSSSYRVLSAGCSSGQECYSLSMAFSEYRSRLGERLDLSILGVDLSASMVETARRGRYSRIEVLRGLDERRRHQFMSPAGEAWEVTPEVRGRVEFKTFNLMHPPSALGRFDAVLCRNVLIYFAPAKRVEIVRGLASLLQPGGYLFLGAAESLPQLPEFLVRSQAAGTLFYRRQSR